MRSVSRDVPGLGSWAAKVGVAPGHGIHLGVIVLALLLIGGLAYGASRLRRGRHATQQDEEWVRREPPPAAEPASGAAAAPARTPRPPISIERPAGAGRWRLTG